MSTNTLKNSFASDNTSTACSEVMEAVIAANSGVANSYGDDVYSKRLQDILNETFETEVVYFPCVSGTAANALALSALTPSHGKIFCHAMSHINTDECGAPEFFTGGAKLVPISTNNGKIKPSDLEELIRGKGNVHSAQPATLSITQSTEVGALYQIDEIKALSATAHKHDLHVHMDGARFANGLVALDTTPAEMTWKAGIDVLSFGGTKNGCLAAEAVVFFKPELVQAFPFKHKRAGQLLSKMRFISAQLEAYISDDVWLRNARHANKMAARLSQGLVEIPGIELAYPTESNEIFAHMPEEMIAAVNKLGYKITEGELDETAPPRFVTSWNTDEQEIHEFLSIIRSVT